MSMGNVTQPNSGSKMQVLKQRLFSTVILLGLLVGVLCWNHELGYYGLVSIFCMFTAWEWRYMLKQSGKAGQYNLAFVFNFLYPPLLSLACYFSKDPELIEGGLYILPLPFILIIFAPALLVVIAFIREMQHEIVGSRALRSVATTLLSFIYPCWLFALAIPSIYLGYMQAGQVSAFIVPLVLWVVLVTKMSDIFAYVSGICCGGKFIKRKLIPHISPKKTYEGLIGSWILTNAVAIGLLFPMFGISGLSLSDVVWLVVAISILFILAVCGDLAGSLIKRSLSIKDSGALLPGIGGLFDLIDSPAFTVPFVFIFLCWPY